MENTSATNEELIGSYNNFWSWFSENEKAFFDIVKNGLDTENIFCSKVHSKLNEIKEGYSFLVGMCDENTAELIMSANGNAHNMVFSEELIAIAPKIEGWKFTALKQPARDVNDLMVRLDGYEFNSKNIYFYANDYPKYPDLIDIVFFHDDMNDQNIDSITNGINTFINLYLGEASFLNDIDNLQMLKLKDAKKDLVSINKLKPFLIWRQKEFIEKYKGNRYNIDTDNYHVLEQVADNDNPGIAIINADLLKWDRKASHPWIAMLTIKYHGENNNGLPDEKDFELLEIIGKEIDEVLIDKDGYLNVGRQTINNTRDIIFVCKDYRKPSKVYYEIQKKYSDKFEFECDIFKDKYWQSLEVFNVN